jgi:hypothetical protein
VWSVHTPISHTKKQDEGKTKMSCKCENKNKFDNQGIYKTEDIIELFWGLLKDGYTGLGFGLILDLIERDVKDQRENANDEGVN